MVVLVTCKFDDDMKKMMALLYSQHFLHFKSMEKKFIAQGQVTPKWSELELMLGFMIVFVTCKFDKDPFKNDDILGTIFSPV